MNQYSKDYHDYVFRDGRLVGDFDAMYRNSETIPWHQDEQKNWVDVRLTAEMMRDIGLYDEVHDLGCGLGYYLSIVKGILGSEQCKCFGYDISDTACAKAKNIWPDFNFSQFDLTALESKKPDTGYTDPNAKRLFIVRATLWYVFPKLDAVINVIRGLMGSEDRLLIVQNFPPLTNPFVGKDVIPNHHALVSHFSSAFLLIRHIWYEDVKKSANDNWFIGLFSTKDI